MYSNDLFVDIVKTLFYLEKVHHYAPSEILNLTVIDYKIKIALLLEYMEEEKRRHLEAMGKEY